MPRENTYAADIEFLKKHTEIAELIAGEARVAVAPEYQGRVMTSTLAGEAGASFGWINSKFIKAGKDDVVFNNYGGEDRFWLGPEAGQFGLWFKKGEPFDLAHWKTPRGFNTGAFEVGKQSAASVAMSRRFEVANYEGTVFECEISRTVNAIGAPKAGQLLGLAVPEGVKLVAYETVNVLKNAGGKAWSRDGGLVSTWILGMFRPLPRGKVIVPFKAGSEADLGPRATADYFGQIPPERCKVADDHLIFTCDGKFRSKIGISPARAKNSLGSYDPDAKVLTIVRFNLPADAPKLPYVNSLWKIQDKPFAGDAVNSYNDGEPTPGAGQLGPFYEIETSSPAAVLAPGESITHVHRTFHLSGDFDALNAIAGKTLGVELGRLA
ncbi:MAG TPA: DUF6786 family protein [Phycisphaerae bacterium]|nr:DUF6786 family protein [Phycisphaerae bacterium]